MQYSSSLVGLISSCPQCHCTPSRGSPTAGVMYYTSMKNLHEDEWERTVDVNCKGTMFGVGAVLGDMVERGGGHIVNISSDAGRRIFPTLAVYCASKYFVEAMSEGLRREVVGTGVKVGDPFNNSSCPHGLQLSPLFPQTRSARPRTRLDWHLISLLLLALHAFRNHSATTSARCNGEAGARSFLYVVTQCHSFFLLLQTHGLWQFGIKSALPRPFTACTNYVRACRTSCFLPFPGTRHVIMGHCR